MQGCSIADIEWGCTVGSFNVYIQIYNKFGLIIQQSLIIFLSEALDTAHQLISSDVQIFSYKKQKFGIHITQYERHRAQVQDKGM